MFLKPRAESIRLRRSVVDVLRASKLNPNARNVETWSERTNSISPYCKVNDETIDYYAYAHMFMPSINLAQHVQSSFNVPQVCRTEAVGQPTAEVRRRFVTNQENRPRSRLTLPPTGLQGQSLLEPGGSDKKYHTGPFMSCNWNRRLCQVGQRMLNAKGIKRAFKHPPCR